jgi:hypothetical protein
MTLNKNDDVMRMWSRASIHHQKRLISRFLQEKGRNNIQRDLWMAFLAKEFSIPDYPVHWLNN